MMEWEYIVSIAAIFAFAGAAIKFVCIQRDAARRKRWLTSQARLRQASGRKPKGGEPSGKVTGALRSKWSEQKDDHSRAAIFRNEDFFPNR